MPNVADINPAMARLSCYDGERAKRDGINNPLLPPVNTGAWQVSDDKHPISGKPTIALMNKATSGTGIPDTALSGRQLRPLYHDRICRYFTG
jgi:hypothetical protein